MTTKTTETDDLEEQFAFTCERLAKVLNTHNGLGVVILGSPKPFDRGCALEVSALGGTPPQRYRLVVAAAGELAKMSGAVGVKRRFKVPGDRRRAAVSAVEVVATNDYDHVRIWNRDEYAGDVILHSGDGVRLAEQHGLVETTDRED